MNDAEIDTRFPGARKAWEEQMEKEFPGCTDPKDWSFEVKAFSAARIPILTVSDGETFIWVWESGQWMDFDDWWPAVCDQALGL